jgi:snRNA-activating protein complex subunit 3
VVLASQTLGDLFEAVPCTSNELPEEVKDDERLVGYEISQPASSRGCVMCIEGIAYGDGQSEMDYAEYAVV